MDEWFIYYHTWYTVTDFAFKPIKLTIYNALVRDKNRDKNHVIYLDIVTKPNNNQHKNDRVMC